MGGFSSYSRSPFHSANCNNGSLLIARRWPEFEWRIFSSTPAVTIPVEYGTKCGSVAVLGGIVKRLPDVLLGLVHTFKRIRTYYVENLIFSISWTYYSSLFDITTRCSSNDCIATANEKNQLVKTPICSGHSRMIQLKVRTWYCTTRLSVSWGLVGGGWGGVIRELSFAIGFPIYCLAGAMKQYLYD